jgi:hypothetical protein
MRWECYWCVKFEMFISKNVWFKSLFTATCNYARFMDDCFSRNSTWKCHEKNGNIPPVVHVHVFVWSISFGWISTPAGEYRTLFFIIFSCNKKQSTIHAKAYMELIPYYEKLSCICL